MVELSVIGPHSGDTKYVPDVAGIVKTVVFIAVSMVTLLGFADAAKLLLEIGNRATGAATPTGSRKQADIAALEEREARPTPKRGRFVACESCGAKTESDSLFCQKCGKPIAPVDS